MTRLTLLLAVPAVVLAITSCGKPPQGENPAAATAEAPQPAAPAAKQPAPPAAPQEAAPPAKPQAPTVAAGSFNADFEHFPDAIDVGSFGSDEPLPRPDQPTRGVITLGPGTFEQSKGAHWETYAWTKFKAKRWGRYQVWITYSLKRSSLGMQFRLADLIVKKPFTAAAQPRRMHLGEVYIPQAGDLPFALLTPPTEDAGFVLHELALVPTCEGDQPRQQPDGKVVLKAASATTWSENMRYEPKPEKNCLGFWTEPDDIAEWEFELIKPGRYQVTVVYGCGGGNQGSEVEVKHGDQSLKFTTQDTGGFQNWRPVPVGEIELKAAGTQRLVIDPRNKTKSAVLDVQQVLLTPVT